MLTHAIRSTPISPPRVFNPFNNPHHCAHAPLRSQFMSQSRLVGGWWVEAGVLAPVWGWLRWWTAGEGVPLYSSCKLVAPVWHPRRLGRWRTLLRSRTASCASRETWGCNPFPLPPHTLLLPDFFQCLHTNNRDEILFLRDTQTRVAPNPFHSNPVYLGIVANSF